jgi:hypothetical protein
VAVGAHRFTGVTLEHLDNLLAGTPTTTFQFNPGDTWIGESTVNLGQRERWRMPAGACGHPVGGQPDALRPGRAVEP